MFKACKDCPDRKLGCHSTCERYLSEKAERARIKERAAEYGLHERIERELALRRKRR